MDLRHYQKQAGQFLCHRNGRALLALPPGAGKTAIVSSYVGDESKGPILVVCPNGPVMVHWQHELLAWGGINAVVGTGSPKHRAAQRDYVRDKGGQVPVLIVNYECMRNDIEELLDIEWETIIFDESHRLKGRKVTFKCAQKLAKVTKHTILVTGTPVLNRADELWVSFNLIDPANFRSYWRWVRWHFHVIHPRYGRRVVEQVCKAPGCKVCGGKGVLPDHVQMIRDELQGRMFYRPMKEILPDLPEMTETTFSVSLTPEEREAYDSMLKDFWMQVGDDVIEAVNTVAQQTRLRQLSSDWSVFGNAPGTKAKAAATLVSDLDGEQAIVFCAFRGTAEAVASLIPDSAAYHGGIDADSRGRLVEAFRAGEIQTLVATISTMGEGVDGLQGCHNVIMLDRLWTPARNEQAIGRCLRLGQKDSVNVQHIVADDTIDEDVNDALVAKTSVIEAVVKSRG